MLRINIKLTIDPNEWNEEEEGGWQGSQGSETYEGEWTRVDEGWI